MSAPAAAPHPQDGLKLEWRAGPGRNSMEAPVALESFEQAGALLDNLSPELVAMGQEYKRDLQAAGGVSRKSVRDDNGKATTFRFNSLTNTATARLCAVCQSMHNPKPCAGCMGVYYCGKACQMKHWREHKTICRLIQRERSTRSEASLREGDAFKPDKFLAQFPGMQQYCRQAVAQGGVLPLILIKLGADDQHAIVAIRNCKTLEEVEEMQKGDPTNAHLYRLDAHLEEGMHRVVVMIERGEMVYVSRVRIMEV